MSHLDEIQLSSYIDGEVAEETASAIKKHLAGCPTCSLAYKSLCAVDDLLEKRLAELEPPAAMRYQVAGRIRQSATLPGRWAFWSTLQPLNPARLRRILWAPAAVLIIVLVLGYQPFQRYRENERLLGEIERYKSEMLKETAGNPFGQSGLMLEIKEGNPFEDYLNRN